MSVYDEIISIANDAAGEDVSTDYKRTVRGALDALADSLAGDDIDEGDTASLGVRAVAPYIGGGGGGGGGFYTRTISDQNGDKYTGTSIDGGTTIMDTVIQVPFGSLVKVGTTAMMPIVWYADRLESHTSVKVTNGVVFAMPSEGIKVTM